MSDFDASSIDTIYQVYRDKVRQSSTVSSDMRSVQDEGVWSTVEIASVKQRMKSSESSDADGNAEPKEEKRLSIIERIEEHEYVAKKQKFRKKVSSGKTKRFFNSIKDVFGSKSKNSVPLATFIITSWRKPSTEI